MNGEGAARYIVVAPKINAYVSSRAIWRCPSDREIPAEQAISSTNGLAFSYSYNCGPALGDFYYSHDLGGLLTGQSVPTGKGSLGRSIAAIQDPTHLSVLMDGGGTVAGWGSPLTITEETRVSRQSQQRHGTWVNMLFADGHTKAVNFRIGRGAIDISGSKTHIALPRDKAYYNSWCVAPDIQIAFDGQFHRCDKALPHMETKVTQWLPE